MPAPKHRWKAYMEKILEAPEVEFSRVWNTESGGENKWSLSVSQSFDWPGVYAARREATRSSRSAMHFLRSRHSWICVRKHATCL